jgi:hypothetical protein
MSESAGHSGGNGAAGPPAPPSFRPAAEPAAPAPRLSQGDGLDRLRRARAAANNPPPPEPPQRHAETEAPAEHERGGEGAEQEGGYEGGGDTYELLIDGKPQRVTLDELQRGYLRQSDYTKKATSAAQEAQKAAETYRAFEHATAALRQKLAVFTTDAGREFQEPVDWVTLAKQDPLGYAEKRARFEALRDAQGEQARLEQLRQAQHAQQQEAQFRAGFAHLTRALPGWKDPATRTKIQEDIKGYALEVGYSEEELAHNPIVDPRQIIVLHDAMNGRRMAGRKVTPNPPEPGRPMRGGTPAPQPTQRVREAEKRFDSAPSAKNGFELWKTIKQGSRK